MKMGLPERALEALYRGGIIHDIGKIGVPDAILLKPGPLNADELARMRMHPAIGEAIVKPLRSGATLLPIIRHHHENFDGSGYPDGLAGRAIPHLARIVAVCDAYDALVTDRPYRGAKSPQQAVAVLMEGAGKQWDAEAVEVLVSEMANITALGIT
jgi:HD-GYP domain-containing protein (c-di-GMP phosphodiesterase class II)